MIEKFIINSDYGSFKIQHDKLINKNISKALGLARFALKGVRNIDYDSENGIIEVEYDEIKTNKENIIEKAEGLLAKYLA